MGVLKMGTVGVGGAKIHANASRHSALSYEHAGKIEAQLKAEVAELMAKAEAADAADIPDGMLIPDEFDPAPFTVQRKSRETFPYCKPLKTHKTRLESGRSRPARGRERASRRDT